MVNNYSHLTKRFGSAFDDLLSEVRETNGNNSYIMGHSARLVATILMLREIMAGKEVRVLELGFSNFLHKYFDTGVACWDYTTFSKDKDVVKVSESFLNTGMAKNRVAAKNIQIDFEANEFPPEIGEYDLIICCEVIEHMECDPMHLMCQVNRLLKEGGELMMTTPNAISARVVYKAVKGYHPSFFMQYSRGRSMYKHNFEYTPELLKRLVLSAGLMETSNEILDTFEDPLEAGYELLRKLGVDASDRGDNIFSHSVKIGPVVNRYPAGIYSS